MADTTKLTVGTRVTTAGGLAATVVEAPYRAASGWYVKVEWDTRGFTASGTSNIAVEDLTVS